ncbi:MAG: hypothetical protein ACO20H_03995 [Bacteriovoracaceae bacterium]
MGLFTNRDRKLTLELDTEMLHPSQVRLVKSINSLLLHLLMTDDEAEYFESSSDFLRLAASVIKESHFAYENEPLDKINYSNQAIEYALDQLQEALNKQEIKSLDN